MHTGAALMDASVVAALDEGRSVVTPSPQAGARLRMAWARRQLAAGRTVWDSPDILTWEAWLAREWQRSVDPAHPCASRRVLNRAQERRLWSQALQELEDSQPAGTPLRTHAAALRRTAHRARQYLLAPPRTATSAEEQLLWLALVRVEALAAQRGNLILGLAAPEVLAALAAPAPGFAGVTLTPLQARLGELLWPGQSLLLPPDAPGADAPLQWNLTDADEEIRGAALWCREQLARDASRRLLVVKGGGDMPLAELSARLWRHLTQGHREALAPLRDTRLLAVEGGEPLLLHPMLEQGITMLGGLLMPLEMADLSRLLLGPWFDWGETDPTTLECALRELGCTQWSPALLLATLEGLSENHPAAAACARRLRDAHDAIEATGRRPPGEWAGRFDRALMALGFPGRRQLDSSDAQCHARWRELLDEFASLDVLELALDAQGAWQELLNLARHGAHEPASGESAITLTDKTDDPLIGYDGIWVLGLTEEAFPAPPRPDAFLSTATQRRALWPEASVELRRLQAGEQLAGWRRRTTQLVMSHARTDGDVSRRPTRLLPQDAWNALTLPAGGEIPGRAPLERVMDAMLPELATTPGVALRGSSQRLQLQQDCPFRAQAQMRLGATEMEAPVEGIDPRLRGQLLHGALDSLWGELRDAAAARALDPAALDALLRRHWQHAERQTLRERLVAPDARALARERRRGLAVLQQVLRLDAARDNFEVVEREQRLLARIDDVTMNLVIDRIDRLADGRRLLIDYKSGPVRTVTLDREVRPLQLALYATALANDDRPVQALALLQMTPGKVQLTGVADADVGIRKIAPLDDWAARQGQWRSELARLLEAHLAGHAEVAPVAGACRRCHLPMFCRINEFAPIEEDEAGDAADE